MSVSAARIRNPGIFVWAAALSGAAASGVLAAYQTELGVAAAVALIAVPMSILYPKLVVHVLLVATFANTLTLGGVTVGRLVAPLALLALVTSVARSPVDTRWSRGTLVSVFCYATIAVSSLLWTQSTPGTVEEAGALALSLLYAGAFAVLLREPRDLRALLWVFAVCSIFLSLLWISRYLSGVDRRFNDAGDPNFFAALQVVSLPLVMVLAAGAKTRLGRVALYLGVGVIAASVVSTLSRGGLLTLLVATLLITLLPTRQLFRSRAQKRNVFIAAIVGLSLLLTFAWEDVAHRFEVGFSQEHVAGGRGDLWLAAWHAYEDHPVTGIGYGAFSDQSFQWLRQTPGVNLEEHLRFLNSGEYVHNAFLGSLAELGPLGLASFLAVLLFAARALRATGRRGREEGRPRPDSRIEEGRPRPDSPIDGGNELVTAVANAAFVSLLAFCVSSIFLSTETSRSLWLLVGLSVALPSIQQRGLLESQHRGEMGRRTRP
ncbi:MAG: O-antigen ligase family protein [Actinomycetota bacterium]|nr:O-antigen ligase family protein [Actinomycetota bacterium]